MRLSAGHHRILRTLRYPQDATPHPEDTVSPGYRSKYPQDAVSSGCPPRPRTRTRIFRRWGGDRRAERMIHSHAPNMCSRNTCYSENDQRVFFLPRRALPLGVSGLTHLARSLLISPPRRPHSPRWRVCGRALSRFYILQAHGGDAIPRFVRVMDDRKRIDRFVAVTAGPLVELPVISVKPVRTVLALCSLLRQGYLMYSAASEMQSCWRPAMALGRGVPRAAQCAAAVDLTFERGGERGRACAIKLYSADPAFCERSQSLLITLF